MNIPCLLIKFEDTKLELEKESKNLKMAMEKLNIVELEERLEFKSNWHIGGEDSPCREGAWVCYIKEW
ncbi:MAG: hypothetical protein HRU25_15300 [Psychrobium sp.]|nr:hypothetical protein [Psychrobium sp.]